MSLKEGCDEDIQKTVIVCYHLQSLPCLYVQLARSLGLLNLCILCLLKVTIKKQGSDTKR